jgi:hypothetical protein
VSARLARAAGGLALIGTLACAHANDECAPPEGFEARGRIEMDGVVVLYRTRPETIHVAQHFALDVIICGKDARELSIDAVMPNHRHGMNYRPRVTASGEGRYLVEGMLFHMPGKWRFFFDVPASDRTRRLWQDIEID